MHWKLREDGTDPPRYFMASFVFTIELHHGGSFEWSSRTQKLYKGGLVHYIDYCDPHEMSYMSIVTMVCSLGWLDVGKLYYKTFEGSFERDLKELKYDRDAIDLGKYVDCNKVVQVFCDRCSDDVESSSDSENEFNVVGNDEILESNFGTDDDLGWDEGLVETTIQIEEEMVGKENGKASMNDGTIKEPMTTQEKSKRKIHSKRKQNDGTSKKQFESDVRVMNEGYISSDEFRSASDSDEDGQTVKYPIFGNADLKEVKVKLGMVFATAQQFRYALRVYALQVGKPIRLKRNEKTKMYAICKGLNCPWNIYCGGMKGEVTVQIKTFHDHHTCRRVEVNPNLTPKFIAMKYKEDVRNNPKWPVKDFENFVARDTQCKVTITTAYKAHRLAKIALEGTSAEQYLLLWSYIEELKRSNPGSTVVMKVKEKGGENGESLFRRLYICWAALKRGFLEGCRPIIGVDGCHLTGPHRGVMLTVVAIDPNNCMYPFAYAVVAQENFKTWKWFLRLLCKDIDIQSPSEYTFISDKQKGLIKAMEYLLPGVEHRFCVRHLYNNFKQEHKGLLLKQLLWKAARASTKPHFIMALNEIKEVDEAAYLWVSERPRVNWSRSHFRKYPKSDLLLNNLCESFNACIKDARGKPILSMLEDIRQYLMNLIVRKKEAMEKQTHLVLCPNIQSRIEELKQKQHAWIPRFNGNDKYEVQGANWQMYETDITHRRCGCNVWQLTGVPCVHAVSSICYNNLEPEKYVHNCYLRDTYMKTYSNFLNPINGKDLWPLSTKPKLLPPFVAVQVGKPQKARRRGPDENMEERTKLSRRGIIITCKKCGRPGHNSRTCGKPVKVRYQGKGLRKPRKKQATQVVDETETESEGNNGQNGGTHGGETGEGNGGTHGGETGEGNGGTNESEDSFDILMRVGEGDEVVQPQTIRDNSLVSEPNGGAINNEDQEGWDEWWDSVGTADALRDGNEKASHEDNVRVYSSQPVERVSKPRARKRPKPHEVRRSYRLATTPRQGPILVSEIDLTKEAAPSHCGIMAPKKPIYQGYLPKGHIWKGDKVYATQKALLAEAEWKKHESKSFRDLQ